MRKRERGGGAGFLLTQISCNTFISYNNSTKVSEAWAMRRTEAMRSAHMRKGRTTAQAERVEYLSKYYTLCVLDFKYVGALLPHVA